MQDAVLVLAVGFGIALLVGPIVAVLIRVRRARRKALVDALRALGASDVRTGWGHASATVQGVAVRWEMRAAARFAPPTTVCSARLVEPAPFELHLRPQTRDELREVRAGRAIDVKVGDRAFDDCFIVEAAPAELARALLDEPTRAGLSALRPPPVVSLAGGRLRVQIVGVPAEALARDIASLVVGMARRVVELPNVLAEQHRVEAQRHDAGGYRGPPPRTALAPGASTKGDHELARLHAARRRRAIRQAAMIVLGLAVLLAFYLIPVALRRCGEPPQ